MRRSVLFLIPITLLSIGSFAEAQTTLTSSSYPRKIIQTDWSAGPGVLGPVRKWDKEFFNSTNINHSYYPGSILLGTTPISTSLPSLMIDPSQADPERGPIDMKVSDFFGNGTEQIASAYPVHRIPPAPTGCTGFSASLAGLADGHILIWFETAGTWSYHSVTANFSGVSAIDSADVDGDGDQDILAAAFYENTFTNCMLNLSNNGRYAWFENVDQGASAGSGNGSVWVKHDISAADGFFWGAESVAGVDFDNDGDIDMVGASSLTYLGSSNPNGNPDVVAYENLNGDGLTWVKHDIDNNLPDATSVAPADIDGDGDSDVVAVTYGTSDAVWYENNDLAAPGSGNGTTWTKHFIDNSLITANVVKAVDIDLDGDMDVIAGSNSPGSNKIFWYENDGQGGSWVKTGVGATGGIFTGLVRKLDIRDLNGDQYPDILAQSHNANTTVTSVAIYNDPTTPANQWNTQIVQLFESSSRGSIVAADTNADAKVSFITSRQAINDAFGNSIPGELRSNEILDFSTSGTLESTVLHDRQLKRRIIHWQETSPANSSVQIEIRSGVPGSFGPWIVVGNNTKLRNHISPGDYLFQYRVTLNASSGGTVLSPLFDSIGVTF